MSRLKLSLVFRKLFVFKGYKLCCVESDEHNIIVSLRNTCKTAECPACGRRCSNIESIYRRKIRDLDLGIRKCFVDFLERKLRCPCSYRGVEKLSFADKYEHQTKRFEDYVSLLCQLMSLQDAAKVAEIDWKTAKRIDKKYLKRLVAGLESINPTKLGVDEISYRKGHKYLTVVRDLTLGRVIWVGLSRKKETLDKFFKELGESKCSRIRVFVMDMWDDKKSLIFYSDKNWRFLLIPT